MLEHRRGFTMIEAVVIIAVLAILAGILTPMVVREIGKARATRAESDMEAITTAFTQYYADTGAWPERYRGQSDARMEFTVFTSLYQDPGDMPGWDGPYLEKGVMVGGQYQVASSGDTGGCGGEPQTRFTGLVDPWGTPYLVMYGRIGSGSAGAGGAISLVSSGPDRQLDTDHAMAMRGEAGGDDIVRIVTRRIR